MSVPARPRPVDSEAIERLLGSSPRIFEWSTAVRRAVSIGIPAGGAVLFGCACGLALAVGDPLAAGLFIAVGVGCMLGALALRRRAQRINAVTAQTLRGGELLWASGPKRPSWGRRRLQFVAQGREEAVHADSGGALISLDGRFPVFYLPGSPAIPVTIRLLQQFQPNANWAELAVESADARLEGLPPAPRAIPSSVNFMPHLLQGYAAILIVGVGGTAMGAELLRRWIGREGSTLWVAAAIALSAFCPLVAGLVTRVTWRLREDLIATVAHGYPTWAQVTAQRKGDNEVSVDLIYSLGANTREQARPHYRQREQCQAQVRYQGLAMSSPDSPPGGTPKEILVLVDPSEPTRPVVVTQRMVDSWNRSPSGPSRMP